ncbi:MAG: YigZ family protein, partial [Saprospiraceae bacterium]
MESDSFFTIQTPAIGEFKDRGSKFIGFAYPVETVEACIVHLQSLKKEHFKANHHCFAFRIGANGYNFRINDDGEPSGTAGKPILGQIDSNKLTNILVVVVRYFGGTLLGTSGLINAYRQTTAIALKNAIIIEKIIEEQFELTFNYSIMPDVMNAVKKLNLPIIAQQFNENAALITA